MSTETTLNPTATLLARRVDFPTWLPAMLVKELRQGLRARGFAATLVVFQVVMALFTIFAIAGGTGSMSFNILQGAYWVMLNVQLLVITPIRGLTGLQAELESRSVDLLLLTRLTAWRVVLGKWVSLLVQAALLVIAMLPYGVARYFFGSIDLAGEAKLIGLLFGGSAVLTAGALWASALPKIARIGLGLGIFALWQVLPASIPALFSMGTRAMRGPSLPRGTELWLTVCDALIVLVVCLVCAVRRLGPRAESQAPLLRALPLLALLPIPFLDKSHASPQAAVGAALFAIVAIFEFARGEEPMAVHWRTWARRGWWGRLIGRFVQPGWASAFEWVLLIGGVFAVSGLATPWPGKIAQLAMLASVALVFPAFMISLMSAQFTQRAGGYILIFGGSTLIAAVATASSAITKPGDIADVVLLVLPIASFWASLGSKSLPGTGVLAAQIVMAATLFGFVWWRGRHYREQRREFELELAPPPDGTAS